MRPEAPRTPIVLIVDDERANLVALESMLASSGAKFVRAATGTQALSAAGMFTFALVILDDRLPDMRGEEVARHMLGALGVRCPPIVLYIAADFGRAELDAWRAAGIDEVLQKAGDPAVLGATLESFLRRARDAHGAGRRC